MNSNSRWKRQLRNILTYLVPPSYRTCFRLILLPILIPSCPTGVCQDLPRWQLLAEMTCDENEASEKTKYCFWLTDTGLIPPIRVLDLPVAYADAVGQTSALSRQLDLPRHFPRDNHCKAGGKTPPVRTSAPLYSVCMESSDFPVLSS